jgi:hypothetical protein
MMTEFMDQRAKKSFKRNELMPLGRAHPQLDLGYPPAFGGIVQAMKFHPRIGWPYFQ